MFKFLIVLAFCASAFTARAAITDGLLAHYKFDEASGTVATDAIRGATGNGTLKNFPGTQWSAGLIGNAVTLDGVDDWISTPIPLNNNTSTFSFSGWVYASGAPNVWATIAKNWGGNPIGQFHFGLDQNLGQMSNYLTNQQVVRESTVFPLNAWQHVVITYDGTQHRLYRNGSQAASGSMSTVLSRSHSTLALGAKTDTTGTAPDTGVPGFWRGKFDDFGLWNRALSPTEITTIYQNGLAGRNLSQTGAPVISTFTATPPNVPAGGSATLNWTTSGQTSLKLNGGSFVNQDVTGQTSIVTGPLPQDTTFTLTATNPVGSTSLPRLVGVGGSVLDPVISEFLAEGNTGVGLVNSDYKREDWIEIYNPNTSYTLDLTGYCLTDNPGTLDKWTFPPGTLLAPGAYLLIFCTENNLPLHASFKLSTEGEYLALVRPNGTIAQQFAPLYPPQAPDISYGPNGYLATPTPGTANSAPSGPFFVTVTENPPPPADAEPLVIEATLDPITGTTISSASLYYRVMFNSEVFLPMTLGGDGIYRATIPASASTPGQMIRWRVTASDSAGRNSKWPLYRDAANSPQYLGTMVQAPAVVSTLPVLHRFVENTAAIDNDPGTRCSIFFNGEFFDNLGIRIRGNTSRGWPKKSHKIEMNSGHKFRWRDGVARVTEFDLNTTYTDKSYVRSILSSEHQRAVGLVSPEIFAMRVQQNAAFYSVTLFTENPDEDMLLRQGLDPTASYYKAPNNNKWETADGFEKKTRLSEGSSDLAAFISKLGLSGTNLETAIFDEADIPGMVNYIATTCITQNIDASDKNHFAYRDTNGTREWTMLPWDLDLTFGPDALNTDNMVASQNYASHPYIGASPYLLHGGKYNKFLEAMINTSRTRAMVDRRIRTLTDQFLATNWFQNRIDQLIPILNADVTLDRARWGSNGYFGASHTLQVANDRIKGLYLTPRYTFLHNGGGVGLPATPPSLPVLAFGVIQSNPANGNQKEEYIEIKNNSAFSADLSGWKLEGQAEHTFKPGTVILPGETLYLSPDVVSFRARATSPKGGERRLIQGNYPGQLSSRGGALTIRTNAATPVTVATTTYPANPSAVQQSLRITEVNFAPAGGGGNPAGNYEFIELRNTGPAQLSLAGIKLAGGLDFAFTASSSITTLDPGAYVLVVKNTAAFNSRYGSGLPVAGEFTGSLDNSGDRIHLLDASGENVLDFIYLPTWHPVTNGGNFTLTTANELQDYTQWDFATGWKPSGKLGGTPGTGDLVGDADSDGLPDWWEAVNGLSPTSAADALLDLDNDGLSNAAEFTAGTAANDANSRFKVDTVTRDTTNNTVTITFTALPDKSYLVQKKGNITDATWLGVQTTPAASGTRTITFTEATSGAAVYRVVTPAP